MRHCTIRHEIDHYVLIDAAKMHQIALFFLSSVTRLNTLAKARYVLCKCTAQFFNGHVSENIRKLKMEDFLNSCASLHFHFPGREAQIAEKGQNKVKAGDCALPAKKCFHYPLQI